MFDMIEFVRERDAALLSLDKSKIIAYCNKYEVGYSDNETVFWAGVHKAIVNAIRSATDEQKKNSASWLTDHGFKTGM